MIKNGFVQWILRSEIFNENEFEIIGKFLYSLSLDLDMLSQIFLSSETDKIDSMSVSDILQSKARDLIDSLFPRGKIYRSRFGSQLPILSDEGTRLHKLDIILSLLFSFVHRSLGPVTLWLPEDLIINQVIWMIDAFEHDILSAESLEYLSPEILFSQESLFDTIFSGLASSWNNSKDINMAEMLTELRIPLLFVSQQISEHKSSFSGASDSATLLSKIIEREVAEDVRSVYETGNLVVSHKPKKL